MKKIVFGILSLSVVGCLEQKVSHKVGDCVMRPDSSTVFKITVVDETKKTLEAVAQGPTDEAAQFEFKIQLVSVNCPE